MVRILSILATVCPVLLFACASDDDNDTAGSDDSTDEPSSSDDSTDEPSPSDDSTDEPSSSDDSTDEPSPSDDSTDDTGLACSELCTSAGFSGGTAEVYPHEVNCTCEGDDSNAIADSGCADMCDDLGWDVAEAYAANACQCSGANEEPGETDSEAPNASGGNGVSEADSDLMLTVTSGTERLPEGDYGLVAMNGGAGAQGVSGEVFIDFTGAAGVLPDGMFVPSRDSRLAVGFRGLNGTGTSECGEIIEHEDDHAQPVTLSLGVVGPEDGASYASNLDGSSCTITVTAFGSGGLEATFEATLYSTSLDTPDEFVSFTGSFTAPDAR